MITLEEKLANLSPERQKRIEELTQELIAQEMTLRTLRRARQMTQANLAKRLRIKQENVSRIENRTDLLLSTLSKYIEGMGGKLRIVAEFPDSPPITISAIKDLDDGLTKEERTGSTHDPSEVPQTKAA